MTTPPDTPDIADLNLPALLRRVKIAIPLGLVVFVAGAVVIATGPLGLGVALLARHPVPRGRHRPPARRLAAH